MKSICSLSPAHWELAREVFGEKRADWTDVIPATVPGNIVLDLHRAGLVPDPLWGENFRACAWTAAESFYYRTTVPCDPAWAAADGVFLQFDGIDTFAEVFVNTVSVGTVHNMFERHRFEITDHTQKGKDIELVVRIDPVLSSGKQWIEQNKIDLSTLDQAFGIKERPVIRKMQMSFGWDNCPHLVTGGIFRKVRIESRSGPVLKTFDWRVERLGPDGSAHLVVGGETAGTQPGEQVKVRGVSRGKSFEGVFPVTAGRWQDGIEVKNVDLWWPNGLGDASFYDVTIELLGADGKVLDTEHRKIGLRTFELDTSVKEKRMVDYRLGTRDNFGMDGGFIPSWSRVPLEKPEEVDIHHFQLRVNGLPVFLRGANWQTPDIFPGQTSRQRYRKLIQAAVDANLNVLRLWGGGVVEDDAFYEICSELGIMVWQDFHFACARYPREEVFLREIEREAADIVQRLQGHTSLALWCGDNESDMIDYDRGFDPAQNPINKKILPAAIRRYDFQNRGYHPSSPSGGPFPRSEWAGDRRDWGAWYPDRDYEHIRLDQARIVSEGGSYALPDKETIASFLPPSQSWPLSRRTWRLHGGDVDLEAREFGAQNDHCWKFFGQPQNLEEGIEISQFAQAWGYKRLVEHHRRRRNDCGGVVLWKLNDCWPANDAGLLDYHLRPRLAYEFVREASRPVAVSLCRNYDKESREIVAWLVNDSQQPVEGTLELRFWGAQPGETFALGKTLTRKIMIGKLQAEAKLVVPPEFNDYPVIEAAFTFSANQGPEVSGTRYAEDPAVALAFHRFLAARTEDEAVEAGAANGARDGLGHVTATARS